MVEMDRKIADLDAEITRLLGAGRTLAPGRSASDPVLPPGRGFTLKY